MPIGRLPIENGGLRIVDGRIVEIGEWNSLTADFGDVVVDLGEVVLLPGLINSHCHLEYSGWSGNKFPRKSFPEWAKAVIAFKKTRNDDQYTDSVSIGIQMLLKTGVTSVADTVSCGQLISDYYSQCPLNVFGFLEMTHVLDRKSPELVIDEALCLGQSGDHWLEDFGLSPHALYSTSSELIRLSAKTSIESALRLSVHISESPEEYSMFRHSRGEMFDWLASIGRDMSDCGFETPVGLLDKSGALTDQTMVVHANYLEDTDIQRISDAKAHVVHCPQSWHFFGYQNFSHEKLTAKEINVCLGTDSTASMDLSDGEPSGLNMFAEMNCFCRHHPEVSPEEILRMTTMNGAKALGREGQIGELSTGAHADLIVIPYQGRSDSVGEFLIHHSGRVGASMIRGEWVIPPDNQTAISNK